MLPLALLDRFIGREVRVVMRGNHEIDGILQGFDDYINIVLNVDSKQGSLLLNGNNIVGISILSVQ
jgi:small nuclear ribonucleoprotein (snRNP)-like protein